MSDTQKREKTTIISIVILHYNDFELTRNYVYELEKQDWAEFEYHIIIVDNASPDGSGSELYTYFKGKDNVDVILSKINMGFARGNNLGIKKAVNEFNSDLVIVSNNDIQIPDTNFMKKLDELYKKTNFDVMGPDIYSIRRKFHQSPIRKRYMSVDEINDYYIKNKKMLKIMGVIDVLKVYNFISFVKGKVKGGPKDSDNYKEYQDGVVLQGAFFVLAKSYLKAYPDGLYPKTFLYMEEDILNYRIRKKGLKELYIPELQVLHYEGASTIKDNKNNRCKKYMFELKETNNSCIVMKEYLERDDANE